MEPIEEITQCPAAFIPLAEKINALIRNQNKLIALKTGPGLQLTETDNDLRLDLGKLTVELTCNEGGGATGTITAA